MSLLPFLSLLLLHLFIPCNSFTCLPSSKCGDIQIKYPFSLYIPQTPNSYDETQNRSTCGYPGLSISCENKTPILHLQSDNYTVTSINYITSTITLADTDILNPDDSCPRVTHNVSFHSYDWINFTNSDMDLIFYFNCSSPTFPPNFTPLTCFGGNKYNYVIPSSFYANPLEYNYWVHQCEEVVVAPIFNNSYNPSNLSNGFGSSLKNGFQLQWDKGESDNCTKCEANKGQCGYHLTSDNTFVEACLCSNNTCGTTINATGTGHKNKKDRILIGIGVSTLLAFCMFSFLFLQRKKMKVRLSQINERNKTQNIEATLECCASLTSPKMYTFSEIRKMTKSFSEKLGQGGYGSVFKGKLNDGNLVAVKVFKDRGSNGEEFINEVASIARTSHVNIVRLLGFSIKRSNRALIYEFMPNGSLGKYLHERKNVKTTQVEFEKLFEITVGIARGLEYLHRGCNTRIVHFDIKPHNILLDSDYCPKISDFGLAKLCRPKESIISMSGMRGTIGYIAPEVFSRNFGTISSKSDVYSFGMMILEMLGEEQNKTSEIVLGCSETYFPDNIYKHLEENTISFLYGLSDANEAIARKIAIVGLWCIQLLPDARPTMSQVLDMLEGSVEDLSIPQKFHLSLPQALVANSLSTELPSE